jgi:Protein of unknown function (DUF1236)
MRPIGTIAGTIAAGFTLTSLGLVSAAAVAQAQTAVTRQVTSEPVETIVTQGPNGTAVTRRILTPEPGVRTYAPPPAYASPAYVPPAYVPPPAYAPVATEALEQDYIAPAAPPPAPRRVTTSAPRTVGQAPARTRAATVRTERSVRTATRAVAAPASDRALVLTPAQRQTIYRSVVQREYVPVPVPAGPPVVAQTDLYPPPPVSGYPVRSVYPADEPYGDYAYDPYHDQYVAAPYRPAYRLEDVSLVVGGRIPASVPLYAVPEPVVARIPAAAPYSYALIDNRVFLVDPVTDLIVAEITP